MGWIDLTLETTKSLRRILGWKCVASFPLGMAYPADSPQVIILTPCAGCSCRGARCSGSHLDRASWARRRHSGLILYAAWTVVVMSRARWSNASQSGVCRLYFGDYCRGRGLDEGGWSRLWVVQGSVSGESLEGRLASIDTEDEFGETKIGRGELVGNVSDA